MTHFPGPRSPRGVAYALAATFLLLLACTPSAQPAATKAPAQPAPTAGASQPPALAASPATSPAAKPAPAASPVASPAAKPSPAASPVASFDRQAVETFYRGKTMKILVGQAAGGGFDAFARLLARHLPKHIPGGPTIIVENQSSAGGLVAFNTAYTTEPKDGTSIVFSPGSLLGQQLFGNPAVTFDARKFNWLGAQSRDIPACVVRTDSGFNRIEEATGSRELVLGGTAPGSTIQDIPSLMKNLAGLNLRIVAGYGGGGPIKLATESGEVMGTCITWSAFKASWAESLASGEVKVIIQGGRTPHPDLPNVPLMRDLAKNDAERRMFDSTSNLSEYTRVLALPPGVPADRVAALRLAFIAALADREFLADAEKARLEIEPVAGNELAKVVDELFALPDELVQRLKQALA